MSHPVIVPKKLIEVALPLDAINKASAKEKSIRNGHPSTLHLYWARRPLASARAIIFSQTVNDPSWRWELDHPGEQPSPQQRASWTKARRKLFELIEKLVQWENTTNEEILKAARAEIVKSWRETCEVNRGHPRAAELFNPDTLPAFHDPFAGGGAIPLEAQRLGLASYASDLNPVAVLINKAMIEIPPLFASQPPVNPASREDMNNWSREWKGATGLAEDVRYYGRWMRDEAEQRIGHLYPKIIITPEHARSRPDLASHIGDECTVVAWLWARTVRSPHPAYSGVSVPLVSTFLLSSKEGEAAYVEPVIENDNYHFVVRSGTPPDAEITRSGTTAGKRAAFRCLLSKVPIDYTHIRSEGRAGRMGARLMAVVAEGDRGRVYLSPSPQDELVAASAVPTWKPETRLPDNPRDFKTPNYGLQTFGDLFTPRQTVALTTLADLAREVRAHVRRAACERGMIDDGLGLEHGGRGATAYGDAVALMLSFTVSRLADRSSSICSWDIRDGQGRKPGVRNVFARQAVPMAWDYAEANPLSEIAASLSSAIWRVSDVLERLPATTASTVAVADAASQRITEGKIVSTDPPYYDNIGYADLSDFFYVWLRRSMREVFPSVFASLAVPKTEELVATPYRHGSAEAAEHFFLTGMTRAMHQLSAQAHPAFPVTIYYAFKQAETGSDSGTVSTGWETFLDAVIRAGFSITGTWPVRTELATKVSGVGRNMLASSIVLVCRKRAFDAPTATRRDFTRLLAQEIPKALQDMTTGANGWGSPVAPVDLSQAIIGPGMGLFTRYAAVLEADGKPMSVRTALQLINRYLADDEFDADTRFCLAWFEQYGFGSGPYGDAETLAKAKGTAVSGVHDAGVLTSAGGRVQLKKWTDYPSNWDPSTDSRIPVWEVVHHLIRALRRDGDSSAGRLLSQVQHQVAASRQLAYRLYTLCERSGRAEEARAYNELITGWPAIEAAMAAAASVALPEPTLFDDPA